MEEIKKEMKTQITSYCLTPYNRSTSYPIFIVVEDKRIYGVENPDGRERRDFEDIDNFGFCELCKKEYETTNEMPDECEDCLEDTFINYLIEKNVPNLRGAFFFTAKACNEHIQSNRHHYDKTAKSYAISAYNNSELKTVMDYITNE